MKKTFLISSLVILAFLQISFFAGNDLYTKLGCDQDEVKNTVIDNFMYGQLFAPGCKGLYKNIVKSERAEIVNQLYTLIKSIVKSDEFKTRYLENHEYNKPVKPEEEKVTSMDETQRLMIKSLEDQMSNPYLTAEQKEEMKKSIEEFKQAYAQPEMQSQYKEMDESMAKNAKEKFDSEMAKYESEMKEWESMTDINYMIKKRLNDFLSLTSNIDFNAKLVPSGKKMKFENPAFESKSNLWKACFRCGPETINQARAKANEWMKEL
ncbi:MAG: hypothetical protein CVU05_12310 [Bacteroidetes bacterium HGW-Bacteroidetes-21]|jgi:hypothetical protein|nr:MAG: hypothetical protein CVU05_12310 [Bacteroidetes bacterium HGW-Bacteroidetes-21]